MQKCVTTTLKATIIPLLPSSIYEKGSTSRVTLHVFVIEPRMDSDCPRSFLHYRYPNPNLGWCEYSKISYFLTPFVSYNIHSQIS